MFLVAVVINQSHFYRHIARFIMAFNNKLHVGINGLRLAIFIEHFNKLHDSTFAVKSFCIGFTHLRLFPEDHSG